MTSKNLLEQLKWVDATRQVMSDAMRDLVSDNILRR